MVIVRNNLKNTRAQQNWKQYLSYIYLIFYLVFWIQLELTNKFSTSNIQN